METGAVVTKRFYKELTDIQVSDTYHSQYIGMSHYGHTKLGTPFIFRILVLFPYDSHVILALYNTSPI